MWPSGAAGELGPIHVDRLTPTQLPQGWSFTALASGAVVQADVDDDVCFYAHATTHLVADLAGFFTQRPVVVPTDAG